MSNEQMNEDTIRDLAIRIVNQMVSDGLLPDCTDTDDETEFAAQDIVCAVLSKHLKPYESTIAVS